MELSHHRTSNFIMIADQRSGGMTDMTVRLLAQLSTANIMEAVNVLLVCGCTRPEKLLVCLAICAERSCISRQHPARQLRHDTKTRKEREKKKKKSRNA